jgi:chromosome segregation ATPase
MSQKRTYEQLVEQVGQLRTENYNLRKIYEQQKQAALSWRKKYKGEKEKRLILENTVKGQTKQIEKLGQELESLKKMMFATKKKGKEDTYEIQSYKKGKRPIKRPPSSYQRAIPLNEEITTTEGITITNCPVCNTPLINKKKTIKYVEDIRVPEN